MSVVRIFADMAEFSPNFLGTDVEFDLNEDGQINFLDFARFTDSFLSVPGPSPVGSICKL